MKPLRRNNKRQLTHDPDTGQDREWELEQKRNVRTDDGSVDTVEIVRKTLKDCGCDAEIGGFCFECRAISCISCHGRCNKCQKPICLQHSNIIDKDNGETERLCGTCHDVLIRKRGWAKIGRLFLSFFTESEEKSYEG